MESYELVYPIGIDIFPSGYALLARAMAPMALTMLKVMPKPRPCPGPRAPRLAVTRRNESRLQQ